MSTDAYCRVQVRRLEEGRFLAAWTASSVTTSRPSPPIIAWSFFRSYSFTWPTLYMYSARLADHMEFYSGANTNDVQQPTQLTGPTIMWVTHDEYVCMQIMTMGKAGPRTRNQMLDFLCQCHDGALFCHRHEDVFDRACARLERTTKTTGCQSTISTK
jgi:hypothetical protein